MTRVSGYRLKRAAASGCARYEAGIWSDPRGSVAVMFGLALALEPWGNAGLWTAQLIFYVARGAGQMRLYPKRFSESFPEAHSAAATPQASVTRA